MSSFERIIVAGAGAFGTALAVAADRAGRRVTLWARDPGKAAAIRSAGENPHLPGVRMPPRIAVTADRGTFGDGDLVLLAVPAQETRAAAKSLAAVIPDGAAVVACAKGVEATTGLLQTAVLRDCLRELRIAALSGPGFADEIAHGRPTALTVAAANIRLAHAIAAALSSAAFRLYATDDVAGVELGGALKNVLAIACGIVAGRELGESARAALIARGLAEMTRLGGALGARPETFMGLSGLGDLVLTATSAKSRNTSFGIALGRGESPSDLLAGAAPLAEGARSAQMAAALARRHGVEAPIIEAVAAILAGATGVEEAIEALVSRPLRAENG